MALPITVPFTFANATTTQNLSSLDADFATVYNAVNGIGNGTVTLSNVNVTGGNISNVTFSGVVASPENGYQRNRIINGAMMIDQRNAGASGTATSIYPIDRWAFRANQTGKGTWGQNLNSVSLPNGFVNYLGFQSSSAYSVLSTDAFTFEQSIEANNVYDFGWGTANAKTVTLSFWAYSSLTGTFGGVVRNYAATRGYAFTYSIPVANTWTYITTTIPGDTGGTWVLSGTAGSVAASFNLGVGSSYSIAAGSWTTAATVLGASGVTSIVGTNGATFYITGVQFEVGTVATPFERRQFGTELSLCQRYYSFLAPGTMQGAGYGVSTNAFTTMFKLPTTMRITPTLGSGGFSNVNLSAQSIGGSSVDYIYILNTIAATGAFTYSNTGNVTVSAEL